MNKETIIAKLQKNHEEFSNFILDMDEAKFSNTPYGEWSAGQHLDHIIRSIKPLQQGLILPFFLIKLVFGKPIRSNRTYDETIELYHKALENGGKASGQFIPKKIKFSIQKNLVKKHDDLVLKLLKQVASLSEKDLDTLLVPHPLLGKMTLREMMYFTIYHVHHHLKILKR